MSTSEPGRPSSGRLLPSAHLFQIAGVIDQVEADLLVALGVRLLGFPLRLPVHREDLSEDAAGRIIRGLPPGVLGVVITYLDQAADILDLCRITGAGVVQLHGDIPVRELERLRCRRPGLAVIKSLVVREGNLPELFDALKKFSPLVDAFITDTFDPATGASGATGKTHDWAVSRALVAASPRPVMLAGGLTPENVREAVTAVGPAGVDAHTGVEDARGRKNAVLVRKFLAEAEMGFAGLHPGSAA